MIPINPAVTWGKLPNGLSYFIRQNTKPEKKVELRLVINAGSILEDADQQGLAHFMEHMCFNGTTHFPKNELVSYLATLGIKFGADLNAYTSFDETVYILPVPAQNPAVVEQGLAVLRDWAGNVTMDEEEINKERGVVLSEMRGGLGADERMRQQYFPTFLNQSLYAERLPIGKEDILKNFGPDVLKRFYSDWYRPDLMAVMVVGDIDPADMELKIHNLFADLTNPDEERPRQDFTPVEKRPELDVMVLTDKELPYTRIEIINYLRRKPQIEQEGQYRDLLVDLLFNNMINNRLSELQDQPDRPFLYAEARKQLLLRGYEAFSLTAILSGEDPTTTLQLLLLELEQVKRYGFTSDELLHARQEVVKIYEKAKNEKDKTESAHLAEELVRHFTYGESIPGIDWEYDYVSQHLNNISLDEINSSRLTLLEDADNHPFILITAPLNTSQTLPEAADLKVMALAVAQAEIEPYEKEALPDSLLTTEPQPGELTSTETDELNGTTTLTFANGVKVILKPTAYKNDEIIFQAVRPGGHSVYPAADHYNASLSASAVAAMGFGEFSPNQLQRFLKTKEASCYTTINTYTEELSGSANQRDFQTLLQLIYLKMTAPRLNSTLFNSYVTQMASFYNSMSNSPDSAFEDKIYEVMSQNHPRAYRVGKPSDYEQLELARTYQIYQERFGNAHDFTFIFGGSLNPAEITPLLTKYLGGLPAQPYAVNYTDLGIRYPAGLVNEELRRGSEEKSTLLVIYTGDIDFNSTQKMKLDALTEVMRFRVIETIREELGSSYSPSVSNLADKVPVEQYRLLFYIACAPTEMTLVEETLRTMIDDIKAKGATQLELDKIKEIWRTTYRVKSQTNQYWVEQLKNQVEGEITAEDTLHYLDQLEALTLEDIQVAANEFLRPDNIIKLSLYPESSPLEVVAEVAE